MARRLRPEEERWFKAMLARGGDEAPRVADARPFFQAWLEWSRQGIGIRDSTLELEPMGADWADLGGS